MFIWKAEKVQEEERGAFLLPDHLTKCLEQPGLGHPETNNLELHLVPTQVTETQEREPSPAVSQGVHEQEAGLEARCLGFEQGILIWNASIWSDGLAPNTTTPAPYLF